MQCIIYTVIRVNFFSWCEYIGWLGGIVVTRGVGQINTGIYGNMGTEHSIIILTPYSIRYIVYTVQCTPCDVHRTLYSVPRTLYSERCTDDSVHWTREEDEPPGRCVNKHYVTSLSANRRYITVFMLVRRSRIRGYEIRRSRVRGQA